MRQTFLHQLLKSNTTRLIIAASLVVVFVALAGAAVAPQDPLTLHMDQKFAAPSAQHWLGTDNLGRDLTSRVIAGAGMALQSCLIILVSAVVIGSLVGLTAGYSGGLVDEALMRLTDVFIAFPGLVLALAISAALGPSLEHAMLAIAVVWWPGYARLVRGQVLSIKERAYVHAAQALGAGGPEIIWRHILPNILIPLVIQVTLDLGPALVTTSSLSFIGMGAQPPAPEWGSMVSQGRKYLLDYWWISTFPGLAIFVTVLVFNSLGERVRKALVVG
jgi:peptide/nickel transport system permease protein